MGSIFGQAAQYLPPGDKRDFLETLERVFPEMCNGGPADTGVYQASCRIATMLAQIPSKVYSHDMAERIVIVMSDSLHASVFRYVRNRCSTPGDPCTLIENRYQFVY